MRIILPAITLAVSILYGLPNLILFSKLGNDFTPFTLIGSPIARDETFAYAPEVNYVYSNKSLLREVYSYEYKDSPTPFLGESAPAALLALLKAFTGSLEGAFIAADFIFPPIIFLAFYFFTKYFIKNNLFAATAALVAVVSRDFIGVIPYPSEIIKYLTVQENQNYLLHFSRAFHPQVSFIFLIGSTLSILKLIQNPKSLRNIILFGVSFGLIFYSYVFYWTLFSFFYLLLILYFLYKKQITILKGLIISGLLAFTVASVYLVNIYYFYRLPFIDDFVTKSSLHNVPIPLTLLRYFALIVILFFVTKKKNNNFIVLAAFLIAGIFITPVSKFLIGQDLETFHYLRRAVMPFATVSLFVILYSLLSNKKLFLKMVSLFAVITFLVFAINTQITLSEKIEKVHIRNHDLESTMQWLEKNTEKSSVIGLLDPDFSSLLPVYTQNKVFMPPTDRTVMPTFEGVERYKIISELLGLDADWQKKNLDDLVSYFFVYQSYDQNRNLDINSPRRQRAEKQIDLLSKNRIWKDKMKNYKLDFIIITPSELEIVKPDPIYLKAVTSINQYVILKVI